LLEDETYRKLFVAESRENHENIVSNLLMLEEGKDDNAIDEIFRSAHTLKGMSASMGYSAMEHLCHAMENVFHSIRNNELSVSPGLIDLLLSCTDRIEEMLDDVESGGDSSSVISEDLVIRLNDMDKSSRNSSDTSAKESQSGIQKYHVTITVDESCNMKDIRAMLVFQNLENIGEILTSSPSPEQIDAGEFDGLLNLEIETDAGEEALRSALSIPEISITEIKCGFGDAEDLTEQFQLDEVVSEDVDDVLSGEKYRISVNVDDSCNMKDVRAMLVINNLKNLGNIISTTPSAEKIDNGEFDDSLEVIISSDAGSEALYAAAFGTEIANVDITLLDDEISDALKLPGSVKQSDKTTAGQENGNTDKNKKKRKVKNLRVDIARLDQMMNLVEDLVINGGRLKQISQAYKSREMDEALSMVSRSISDLQNLMMTIRMIPLNQIFNRFPRVVRDVAHHDGKDVEFLMYGGETELDRSVMDGLGDPLLHLIRNGVNHGIESPEERESAGKTPKGTLILSAWREQGNVIIELKDDGAGINRKIVLQKAINRGLTPMEGSEELSDEEIINFLFQPGFSTASEVTDISGRGVGLDVVKSAVESLNGSIRVESIEGEGSTFTLILPPTMAIIDVMMVRINGLRCAIPINAIVEIARVNLADINRIGNSEVLRLRDEVLQIHKLDEMFGGASRGDLVVIVQYQGNKCCVPVDVVEGQQEVVVKPISNIVGSCAGVGGVTIPGDGDVVPILDINSMV